MTERDSVCVGEDEDYVCVVFVCNAEHVVKFLKSCTSTVSDALFLYQATLHFAS